MKKIPLKKPSEAQFGAKLPYSLIKQVKKYAFDHDLKIKDVVKEALEGYLGKSK